MRALVTNDDGIDAEGLQTLVTVAVGAGLDVVVPLLTRSSVAAAPP